MFCTAYTLQFHHLQPVWTPSPNHLIFQQYIFHHAYLHRRRNIGLLLFTCSSSCSYLRWIGNQGRTWENLAHSSSSGWTQQECRLGSSWSQVSLTVVNGRQIDGLWDGNDWLPNTGKARRRQVQKLLQSAMTRISLLVTRSRSLSPQTLRDLTLANPSKLPKENLWDWNLLTNPPRKKKKAGKAAAKRAMFEEVESREPKK